MAHEALTRVTRTDDSWVLFILRLGLAVVILPHGLQKVFGWFGGFGFQGTMGFFTETMGFPWILGLAAIVFESLGALLLFAGVGTRIAAVGVGVTMLVAMITVHLPHGFFMNWAGSQAGEGVEFFLLAIALSTSLLVGGGGRFSVDRLVSAELGGEPRPRSSPDRRVNVELG